MILFLMIMAHYEDDAKDDDGDLMMMVNTVMMTMMTDTKVKETIAKVRESGGVMMNHQLQTMIKGIWGEDGRDKMYKDEGGPRRRHNSA